MTEPWAPISPQPTGVPGGSGGSVGGRPSRRKLALAGVGTALAAALLALLLWSVAADNSPAFTTGDDSGEADTGGTDGADGSGGTDDADDSIPPDADDGNDAEQEDADQDDAEDAAPPSADEDFEALVEELSAFVEAERELEFIEPATVRRLDDDAFVDRYNTLIDEAEEEDAEELELFTGINQALGILPDGVTLLDATRAFGSAGVLGFYNPEDGELVVRGGEVNVLVKTIIVHELVHALDLSLIHI